MHFTSITPQQGFESVGWVRLDQLAATITLVDYPAECLGEKCEEIERALHPVIGRTGIGRHIACRIAPANTNLKLGKSTICIQARIRWQPSPQDTRIGIWRSVDARPLDTIESSKPRERIRQAQRLLRIMKRS